MGMGGALGWLSSLIWSRSPTDVLRDLGLGCSMPRRLTVVINGTKAGLGANWKTEKVGMIVLVLLHRSTKRVMSTIVGGVTIIRLHH